jgi:hypothetical protein
MAQVGGVGGIRRDYISSAVSREVSIHDRLLSVRIASASRLVAGMQESSPPRLWRQVKYCPLTHLSVKAAGSTVVRVGGFPKRCVPRSLSCRRRRPTPNDPANHVVQSVHTKPLVADRRSAQSTNVCVELLIVRRHHQNQRQPASVVAPSLEEKTACTVGRPTVGDQLDRAVPSLGRQDWQSDAHHRYR